MNVIKFPYRERIEFPLIFSPFSESGTTLLNGLTMFLLHNDLILALDLFQLGQLDGFTIGTIDPFRFNA